MSVANKNMEGVRLFEDMEGVDRAIIDILTRASGGGTIGLRQAEHVIRMLRQGGFDIVRVAR